MDEFREDGPEDDGLYGHVLQQLSMALAGASPEQADDELAELEIHGLSPAEVELIHAWLRHDWQWLAGWHAAARQQAQLARRPAAVLKKRLPASPPGRLGRERNPPLSHGLSCAICGSQADWLVRPGLVICPVCGSQLMRVRASARRPSRH